MYRENVYTAPYTVEHEMFHKGEYGGAGEKRRERKRTPEEIARWNHNKKVKLLRRTIQLNFVPGDPFITLKWPKGCRPSMDEVKECFKVFREILRKEYKKQNRTMKYIYRIEIGKRGGIHLHVIMSNLDNALQIMTMAWAKARGTSLIEDMVAQGTTELPQMVHMDGKVDMQALYLEGGYNDLADYMCKPIPNAESLSRDEIKEVSAYGTSRNLVRPEPERKVYTRRTVRKLIEAGPEKINTDPALRKRFLRPGFIIDKTTWRVGVNPVTGMSYLEYTEVRIT